MNTLTDPAKQALEKARHAVKQGEKAEGRAIGQRKRRTWLQSRRSPG